MVMSQGISFMNVAPSSFAGSALIKPGTLGGEVWRGVKRGGFVQEPLPQAPQVASPGPFRRMLAAALLVGTLGGAADLATTQDADAETPTAPPKTAPKTLPNGCPDVDMPDIALGLGGASCVTVLTGCEYRRLSRSYDIFYLFSHDPSSGCVEVWPGKKDGLEPARALHERQQLWSQFLGQMAGREVGKGLIARCEEPKVLGKVDACRALREVAHKENDALKGEVGERQEKGDALLRRLLFAVLVLFGLGVAGWKYRR